MALYAALGVLGLIIISVLWAIGIYNSLVRGKNTVANAFSQIDVQLKRRYDLIPNLVETAKGYMKHERETLEAVIAARTGAVSAQQNAAAHPGNASAMKGLMQADGQVTAALGRLNVVFEKYPDLKANQNMSQLMEELTSTENKISFARQAYNDVALSFNSACETFPNLLIAGPFKFTGVPMYEVSNVAERENVKVAF